MTARSKFHRILRAVHEWTHHDHKSGHNSHMNEQQSHFRGSWRTLATVSCILSLGLIGSLLTVGFLKGVDALSTIALTLAVIAFIAQLVIFAIQTTHSGEQLREARELNTNTLGLLGELRTRVDTTYQMVSSHNDVLLKLASVKAGGSQTIDDPSAVATERPTAPATRDAYTPSVSPKPTSSIARVTVDTEALNRIQTGRRDIKRLYKLPSEEVLGIILDKLELLPDIALFNLSLNFGSYLTGTFLGQPGDIMYSPGDKPLVEAGLVEKFKEDEGPRVRMTEEGILSGTIFAAKWPATEISELTRERIRVLREKASPVALQNITELSSM